MDLFFNELSMKECCINYSSVESMAKVYKELAAHRITTCRMETCDYVKLLELTNGYQNVHEFFFSFFKQPCETGIDEEKQKEYFEHEWQCMGENCVGVAFAFILHSASFSIYDEKWKSHKIEFEKDGIKNFTYNMSLPEHVESNLPYIQSEEDIELDECNIEVSKKEISLRDDHGKDVLVAFSKRLLQCPYLIKVVNSLPFNPHQRRFIKNIKENGVIEIVLPWTDEGLGIAVLTTGKNYAETLKISKILENEYGHL